MPVRVALQPRQTSQDWLGQFLETVEPAMKKIPNSSRRLSDHISRALNKIRKPSTIVHIPGAWNVTLVRQTDGIVVVEAPISSGYSVRF